VADEARRGDEAVAFGLAALGDDQGGRARVQPRRIAGRDAALAAKGGAQLGQAFGGRVGAIVLVAGE